ncbi:MAG: acetylxylan esterase [Kiritimatiellia bacterium]
MRRWLAIAVCGFGGTLFASAPDAGGFVCDWLLSGPYPNYRLENGTTKGLETDFLADVGGELCVFPRVGDRRSADFKADQAKLIAGQGSVNEWGRTETFAVDTTWRARSFAPGAIATDGLFPGVENYFVLYALAYFTVPEAVEAQLAVGSDDYHLLVLNDRQVGGRRTSQGVTPGEFVYPVTLRKGLNKLLLKLVEVDGGSGFCVQLLDRGGRPLAGVTFDNRPSPAALAALETALHPPRPPAEVEAENARLERRIAQLRDRELPAAERRKAAAERRLGAARAALLQAFGVAEARFAAERAKNLRGAPVSSDLPLDGAEVRRKLCLNGRWEGSVDGGRSWQSVRLPDFVSGHYFQPWHRPVRTEDPDNPWSRLVPVKGWEDWQLNPLLVAESCKDGPILYRTAVEWDGNGAIDFVSESVQGTLEVTCNGTACGRYDGNVGIVRIPLAGLRRGTNELLLKFGLMRTGDHSRDGLTGDLYVEYRPLAHVEGVEIKTGWTSGILRVRTELANRADRASKLTVRTRVVEHGRVRLELPATEVELAPGERRTVDAASKWADPKPWGIGGKYGNPDLYQLVTDVCEGGRTVDRHRETFGYREFRIFHTDFFLNGRRIVLQGDTGHTPFELQRVRDIAWDIYRQDGINVIRTHDGAYWNVPVIADADKVGMLMYLQMYPVLNPFGENDVAVRKSGRFVTREDWLGREEHRWNLANYRRWWRTFRNHPSVVIWSTDNEVLTQAWDTAADAPYNVRSEQIAAMYEKYVKSLDETCVMTRNGDLSTQNRRQRWFEDPPCDTANYHYPDFNLEQQVLNWRRTYEWRPVVFGETLYCSYGAWDGWIGPVPSQVAMKAEKVRRVVRVYREEEIPAAIYMGLGVDGYAVEDDSGKGNPFGITRSAKAAYKRDGTLPPGLGARDYPWGEVAWPSLSGRGLRPVAVRRDWWYYTCELINAFDPRFPAVVRNEVAKAYRETLLPQPPLRNGSDAEVLVAGAAPGEDVWATCPDGSVFGVRADGEGRAWFSGIPPGRYAFAAGDETLVAELPPRGDAVRNPGFGTLRTIRFARPHAAPARRLPDRAAPERLSFTGETNANPMLYACGEEMVFTVRLVDPGAGGGAPVPGYRLVWTRHGDDGLTESGEAASDRPLTVRTRIDRPGFVRLTVHAVDAAGRKVRDRQCDREACWDGGAGADVNRIPAWTVPADLNAFWDARVAELRRTPCAAQLTELESRDDKVYLAKFSVPVPGADAPAQGLVAWPKAAQAGSLPIDVELTGYGFHATAIGEYRAAQDGGRILLSFTRQGEDPRREPAYYENVRTNLCRNFCFRNNDGAVERTDYYRMLMRNLQALRWAKTLPAWNGRDILAHGGSMGGYQALALAALDGDVTLVRASIPWSADFAGHAKFGRLPGWCPGWTKTLDYLALSHLAARVRCRVELDIGLGDYVCPPSGQVLLFNALKGPKRLTVMQNRGHGRAYEANPPTFAFDGRIERACANPN